MHALPSAFLASQARWQVQQRLAVGIMRRLRDRPIVYLPDRIHQNNKKA
jgi:hypothetical protein